MSPNDEEKKTQTLDEGSEENADTQASDADDQASDADDQEKPQPDRVTDMEEIADRLEESRERDNAALADESSDADEADPAASSDEGDKEKPDAADKKAMVQVKVEGQEIQVSQGDIDEAGGVRAYQKEKTADKRLADAKALMDKATQMMAGKKDSPPADGADSTPKLKPELDEDADKDKYGEIIQAIQFGSEEEGAAALGELASLLKDGRGEDSVSRTEEIDARVHKQLHDLAMHEIRKQFELAPEDGGFADIVNDPVHFNRVRDLVKERIETETNPAPNTWDTYRQAGEEIRAEYVTPLLAANAEKKSDDLAGRRERKKEIDNPRAASQSANNMSLEREKTETEERSVAVAEIAKARGQSI